MKYVGVDYHKRYSVATVMSDRGAILAQRRLANRLDDFQTFLKPFGELKAAVEATRNWAVPVEILEQVADQVVLGNPYLIKAIARTRFGLSDKVDSGVIAKLLQLDWLPEAYLRSRVNRDQQLILRVRCFFVRQRTRVKNRIHDLIDRQAETIREHARLFSDLFGKKGLTWLENLQLELPAQGLLNQLLAVYRALSEQVKQSDGLVNELFKSDPNCQLVASVPGLGAFLSVLANVEIGDIRRFANSSLLCSYAGLVPWTESSGGKTWHGPLAKQSNHWLQWAFIEAAIPATAADPGLRSYYEHYRWRKGVNTARVVIGRRLCCIVYRVLRQRTPYFEQKPWASSYAEAG